MLPVRVIEGWLDDIHANGNGNATPILGDGSQNPTQQRPKGGEQPCKRATRTYNQHFEIMDGARNLPVARKSSRIAAASAPTGSIASQYSKSIVEQEVVLMGELTKDLTLSHPSASIAMSRTTSPSRGRGGSPTRSRSPAKTVQDLRDAVPPTIFQQGGSRDAHQNMPATVQDLHMKVGRAIRTRKGFLPGSMKEFLKLELEDYDAEDDSLFDDEPSDHSTKIMAENIIRIRRRAMKCFERNKPEASWGEEVVRPLLDLGTSLARTERDIVVENVTSTNIYPLALIPRGSSDDGLMHQGKRVDYGFFLEPTAEEDRLISNVLQRLPNGLRSINQTDASYLRHMPMLSSVELKKRLSNHDPLLQLAIWNSALFQRLQDLVEPSNAGSLLPIPSISISGHNWEVFYSYIQDNGITRVLRGPVNIGSTDTVLGIYQIVRGLEAIALYGAEEYWPWLLKVLCE